jgi:hypothetical protein
MPDQKDSKWCKTNISFFVEFGSTALLEHCSAIQCWQQADTVPQGSELHVSLVYLERRFIHYWASQNMIWG